MQKKGKDNGNYGKGSMTNNKSKDEPKTHGEDLLFKGSPTVTIGYSKLR
ncbi:unnamed protein product [Arabidopsis halleri]